LSLPPSFNDLRPPVRRSRRIDQVRFSSAIVEEHRQLPQRRGTGAGQHDLARRIIELEALERHRDQFATEADEVAYAQNNKDRPVVAAEDEVVDVTDGVALVIGDRPQLEFVGAVAFGDFLGTISSVLDSMAARSSKGGSDDRNRMRLYRAGIACKCASIAAASSWYE
jgi:hypothetical protein